MVVFKKYQLEIIVFIAGAVVMIFEIVGSRIIGPYVGTSTYVWTSLIGVILACLSLGYYVGGNLADKKPSFKLLAFIILFSSLAIAFSALTKDFFLFMISSSKVILEVKSVLISLILFAPASFFLGMVSPYAVRLKINDLAKAGRTAGNLYAISTTGSIFGTFLAGFYIIPNYGSTNSLIILAIALLLTAILLLFGKGLEKPAIMLVFLTLITIISTYTFLKMKQSPLVADVDTEYNRIWVYNSTDPLTKRPTLVLTDTAYASQAAMFTDGKDGLVYDYTKFYRLFSHFIPDPTDALMIGGSAYTYPRDFIKNYPNAMMDVVEIDPGTTEIARKYFGLKDEKNLTIYHQDARIYLNENQKKYDVIFIDAFNSGASVPYQLTTKEAVGKAYDGLKEGGVVIINIISAIEGSGGEFARAEYATYKEVFPQVFLFSNQSANDANKTQNVMLLALKSEETPDWRSYEAEKNKFLSQVWKKPIANDMPILTDDYAPVDYYRRLSIQ